MNIGANDGGGTGGDIVGDGIGDTMGVIVGGGAGESMGVIVGDAKGGITGVTIGVTIGGDDVGGTAVGKSGMTGAGLCPFSQEPRSFRRKTPQPILTFLSWSKTTTVRLLLSSKSIPLNKLKLPMALPSLFELYTAPYSNLQGLYAPGTDLFQKRMRGKSQEFPSFI